MKKYLLALASFLCMQTLLAQTASDYYIPLCVGNYLKFYTTNNSVWNSRTTYNLISRSDSIHNEVYYLQKGEEILDATPLDTSIFHCFWLKKDISGNIMIGAYDISGTCLLDSATIFPMPGMFFSNSYLTKGFTQTNPVQANVTLTDSVMSLTETVGTYTNCLRVRSTRKSNGIPNMIEDTYYAKGFGKVMIDRIFPPSEVHVDNLVDFKNIKCNSVAVKEASLNNTDFILFPNPSNGMLSLQLPLDFQVNNCQFLVFNLLGKKLIEASISNSYSKINLCSLASGIYFYQFKSGNSILKTDKLLIE